MHIHRRLYEMATKVHGYFFGLASGSFLLALLIVAQMHLLSGVIDRVFMASEAVSSTVYILLAGIIVVRGLFIWLRERLAQQKAVRIKSDIRIRTFNKLLQMGPACSRTTGTGHSIAHLMEGAEKLDEYFTKYLPSIIHIVILPPVIVLLTFYFDWISALIMLVTAPLIVFFMWLIGTYAKHLTQQQWGVLSALSSHFLDSLQGLKTLKIMGANQAEASRVDEASNGFRIITLKVLKVAFLSGLVLELAASISIALVAVQVGIRLIEGLMDYQSGLFILLLAPEFYLPFRTLGAHHHAGMEGVAAAEKVLAIADKPADAGDRGSIFHIAGKQTNIVYHAVAYHYQGAELPALTGVNCQLGPDSMTALVGPTGSGKSTFAFLLLGFLHPSAGQILVNDASLDQLDKDAWRKRVAYVPQHPHFFNASIIDNLLMASPDKAIDAVMHAADQAGAHDFIKRLPRAYDTMLTDNASRLSGGEKQRLAIARAFLKDASVLVLDEPGSNLDPESEQRITEATQRLVKDRTTLVIAHRLQTVQQADHILVLERGQIIQSGCHDSLMKAHGLYASYLGLTGLQQGGKA